MRVVLANRNNVGRVVFNKVAKLGSVQLKDISDVVLAGQQDGDVLVYQANTSTYNIKTMPKIDGGTF